MRFLKILLPAMEAQLSLAIGFLATLVVSFYYSTIQDHRFPEEKPWIILVGLSISFICFVLGHFGKKALNDGRRISLSQGASIIFITWTLACIISAIVFVLAGFPVPSEVESFSLVRRFTDGLFESMSGFTTTGTSILPNVEVFPRSILFWRNLTHWIGGMGIAYLSITVWKHFTVDRSHLINAESETPHTIIFKKENEAVDAGKDFLKIYGLLTSILFILLFFSGIFFRENGPYLNWQDNVYDSLTTAFSTMGTGGMMPYNSSVGLPITGPDSSQIIGGLQNVVSEWIIAFFMLIASLNLSLFYVLFFKRKASLMLKSKEFQVHIVFVALATLIIWLILNGEFSEKSHLQNLRYAFFNVTNIVSTTGFSNDDFTLWPIAAQAILFLCYLVGSSVGSTGGGIKFLRFIVLFKYGWIQMKNLILGRNDGVNFILDGVEYDDSKARLITINILIYYMIFLLGGILILLTASKVVLIDGSVHDIDFVSGFTASIANLGNIGPSIVNGVVGDGPTGNYSAFTVGAKLVMYGLMFIGRVGVLTFLIILMTRRGQEAIAVNRSSIVFDADEPLLIK